MFLWVDLQGLSSTRLSAAARRRGVRVPPGTRFSTSRTHDRFLRLPFTGTPGQLSEAVTRLVQAATDEDVHSEGGRSAIWTV
jgi:DNA-binding transcriptional MocR family regulator